MPDMQFGLFMSHDRDLRESLAIWRSVEDAGFDALGVVDSPLRMREVFVSLAALAGQTERIRLFPSVLNTITRDPTVTAGGYLALHDLAGDRIFLAFGAGDSSTSGVGLGTARLDHMQEYVTAVRELLRGARASYQGRTMLATWEDHEPAEPKIFIAAHGPRSLERAGRFADGVICGFGVLPETVERARELIHRGARSVGRDPGGIEIWHRVFYCPADTVESGFRRANGGAAYLLTRGGFAGKLVPDALESAIAEVGATWSLQTHARPNDRALEVARANGSLDYLASRAGIIGPADPAVEIARYQARGVENILFVGLAEDKRQLVSTLGSAIGRYRTN
jgi:alkanesulfonate monooxygenase SsuD/methylene tetrahydromethanopterin reductase-like flavin-dependent oxidoreductase (luciferase family)